MFSRKLIGTLAVIAAASAVPVASAQTEQAVVSDCIGQPATIVGQPGAGVIRGTNGPDVIAAATRPS
jgi:hypothetical protein